MNGALVEDRPYTLSMLKFLFAWGLSFIILILDHIVIECNTLYSIFYSVL
jgi:hypothetical protein